MFLKFAVQSFPKIADKQDHLQEVWTGSRGGAGAGIAQRDSLWPTIKFRKSQAVQFKWKSIL